MKKTSWGHAYNGFVLGVNYLPRNTSINYWVDWRPDEIDAEFGEIAALGMSTVRIFISWKDFQPVCEHRGVFAEGEPLTAYLQGDEAMDAEACPGLVDPVMIVRFGSLCGLAKKHTLKLIPTIFVGWMSGVCFEPPFMRGRNAFSDPVMLRYQVMLCEQLARRFRDEEAILAWDLGNEQNCFQTVPSVDAAWHWTYLLTNTIRLNDPNHPVISGMHGLGTTRQASQHSVTGRFLIGDVAKCCDWLCIHPYPDFLLSTIDPPLDPRATYISSWQSRLYEGVGASPVMAEEFGTLGDGAMSRETAAFYTQRTLYSLLANGCIGALWWCHSDFTSSDKIPYRMCLMECSGLGLVDVEGKAKPVARVVQRFAKHLSSINCGTISKLPSQAAIILPWDREHTEEIYNSFVLAKRAGLDADIVSPDDPLESYQLLVVPVVEGFTHFTQPQWDKIRDRTASGATLYVSSAAGVIPGIYEMAGVEFVCRKPAASPRAARIVARDSRKCIQSHLQ